MCVDMEHVLATCLFAAAGWPLPLYANYIVQARFERGYVISRRMLSAVEENESNTVQAAALRGQA
jgi:hypothetical protein